MEQIILKIFKEGEPEAVATVKGSKITVAEGFRAEVSLEDIDVTAINSLLGQLL